MPFLDKEALPRRITSSNAAKFEGESLYWYCSTCRKWRTSKVKPGGSVTCSVCGGAPDWKKHPPTLAYRSRFDRVEALCTEDSEWRTEYDRIEQYYGDFIEQTYGGLPARTRDAGWRYFANAWKTIDKVADYLLTAQDSPKMSVPHAYSEDGLQRKYFDSRRKQNVVSLSQLNLKPVVDDDGRPYTDQEDIEIKSFHTSDNQRF